ncbi:hypothetical protein EV356DRAFT_456047, partial [Viridothelium virens]
QAAELERVRTNQRRCRARRKEYIAELEKRIHQCEITSSQSCANLQLKQVTAENDSLKRLLQSLGLEENFLRAYLKASQNVAGNTSRCEVEVTSPPLTSPTPSIRPGLPQYADGDGRIEISDFIPSTRLDVTPPDVAVAFPREPLAIPSGTDFLLEQSQAGLHLQCPAHVSDHSLMEQTMDDLTPRTNTADTTTLCSLAFSLIFMNNSKGYSIADLELKLRKGYKHGATSSEGCRIDNKVLFSVLAEIV